MDKLLLAKLHDILKLTGDSKKHYCPEWCDDFESLPSDLKKLLKHHCVSTYWKTSMHKSGCSPFPIDKEMLCIHLADVKAAVISRKLRRGKYPSFKTFRIWKDIKKEPDVRNREKAELAQHDEVLKEISKSTDLAKLYARFEADFLERSEDAGQYPFASLQTHNELTAAWFDFFLKNADYFDIPDEIKDAKTLNKIRHV